MNNDLLAGILVGLSGELPVSKPGSSNSQSEPGDFIALLRNRINDEFAAGMSDEESSSKRSYSFTGFSDFNPLLSTGLDSLGNSARNDQLKTADRRDPWSTKASETSRIDKASAEKIDRSNSEDRKVEDRADDNDEKVQQQSKDRATEESKENDATDCDSTTTQASDNTETTLSEGELTAGAIAVSSELSTGLDTTVAEEGVTSAVESDLTATNRQDELATEIARLEELLGAISPEEKAALIEALQQLSPEDLKIVAESPDEFCQKLTEMVTEMPDSAEKDALLAMVESPEFLQMMQAMADQQSNTAASTASMPADLVTVQFPAETEAETSNNDEDAAAKDVAQMIDAQEIVNANAVASSETDVQNSADKEQNQADHRETTKNTDGKNVEKQQETASLEPENNKESLREEFKRLNQSADQATTDNQQPETTEEPVSANKSSSQTTGAQPATQEQAKAVMEETVKKFFTLFSEKASGGDRAVTAETYSPEAIKRHSGMSNNSAGNGGNGFSSHTGTPASSMSAARPATPTPAANQIFSQMLEKAEYLKTQNGSKVLNMEFDPGELGKLEMELTSRDGTVSARISAESALAKAQLEELAPQIKEQLLNQGVNLTEITVDISSRNPDESNRDQMSGGKGKSSRLQVAEKEAAEAIIRKNILPNLRRAALNIKAVDLTV